ncbi:sigma factor-like helix-turn-helix DNA-binding protein [uncultured Mitsuokella sp.]|uniref:sigma factor-like helix-turn-helix DNA-binding protein n=1 Tax=uncultured Mitsuokella sp. TaxID=453120 RepID=UPI0026DD1D8A|nr:sigma factor-like helix-turn-helix DNA-binding protein [uncultured Mitsuokella sp.]
MHKDHPELRLSVAIQALNQRYHETPELRRILASDWSSFSDLSYANDNVKRFAIKLMKTRLLKVQVDAVLSTLPEKERRFIILRYRDKKSVEACAIRLERSVSQLNKWHHRILTKVAQFILFELKEDDVFQRIKIINMLEILASVIAFYEMIDPTYRVVDEAAQNALRYRYDKYRRLLTALDDCSRKRQMELRANVVATKVENPGISQQDIADRCYLNAGTVSRCLRNFTLDMYPYLE